MKLIKSITSMDLSVKYMGLNLKSPLIIGSSGLTNSVESIKELEKYGAGAVVLKSLFEEQILFEADATSKQNEYDYPEALDYIKSYAKTDSLNTYLKLIEDCKKEVSTRWNSPSRCGPSNRLPWRRFPTLTSRRISSRTSS